MLKEINKKYDAHQLKKKLFDLTSEKERIKVLLTQYISMDDKSQTMMENAYNQFLNHYINAREEGREINSTHDQLYFIRNKIYHEIRSFNKDFIIDGCLKNINNSLAYIIQLIFYNFKAPNI